MTLAPQTSTPHPEADAVRLLVLRLLPLGAAHAAALESAGFALTFVESLGDAVRLVMAEPPDAVLALADPAAAGSLCEVLRALGPQPLVIAAPTLPRDVAIACLDQGADAAVALPLPPPELVARLHAVWRRAEQAAPRAAASRIAVGDLVVDLAAHAVFRGGQPVELSPTEFDVLALLAERPGRVVTNRELLARVWGDESVDDVHYVRLYIGYLRAKLEDDPRHPRRILTQWGVGYRLAAEQELAVAAP